MGVCPGCLQGPVIDGYQAGCRACQHEMARHEQHVALAVRVGHAQDLFVKARCLPEQFQRLFCLQEGHRRPGSDRRA
jgi:hypothetical protein